MQTIIELDKDNGIYYYEKFIPQNLYPKIMKDIQFEQDRVFVHGKWHSPSRKICAFGDGNSYTYSGMKREGKPYTKLMSALKKYVEDFLKCEFNYVLAQHYPDGNAYISPHGDKISTLKTPMIIISLTFNEDKPRDFIIKNRKTGESITLPLDNGSLLIMKGERTQTEYTHAVPIRKKIKTGRVNFTFRQI